jgi:hypothetical protein
MPPYLKISLAHLSTVNAPPTSRPKYPTAGRKRVIRQVVAHPEDDTDSEIELFPTKPRYRIKRQKNTHHATPEPDVAGDVDGNFEADSDSESVKQLSYSQPVMKRSERILDPNKPEHARLIATTTKVGADYYDSDADDLPGPIKGITKSGLFRNVAWGSYAKDMDNDTDFPTHPAFTQFVPGRFERLNNGEASDQKAKLIIKLTDNKGKKHVYANPPPRDWNNQEAITVLNKRTVQQIRRTTEIKFRARVDEYIDVERQWLLANLTAGKPTNGWKGLVAEFNHQFAGKVVKGGAGPRPARTQSSLSKEVGRFGDRFYNKGLVPVLAKKGKQQKNE